MAGVSTGISLLTIRVMPPVVGPPSVSISGWSAAAGLFSSSNSGATASYTVNYNITINNNSGSPSASGIQTCYVEFANTRGTASATFNATPTYAGANQVHLASTSSYYGTARLVVIADGVTFMTPFYELRLAPNYSTSLTFSNTTITSWTTSRAITAAPNPDPWGETGYAVSRLGSATQPSIFVTNFSIPSGGSHPNYSFRAFLGSNLMGNYTGNIVSANPQDYLGNSISNGAPYPIPLNFTRNFTWPLAASHTSVGAVGDAIDFTISGSTGAFPESLFATISNINFAGIDPSAVSGKIITEDARYPMGSYFEVSYSNSSGSTAWTVAGGVKGTFYPMTGTRARMIKTSTSTTYGISVTFRLISNPAITMTRAISITV